MHSVLPVGRLSAALVPRAFPILEPRLQEQPQPGKCHSPSTRRREHFGRHTQRILCVTSAHISLAKASHMTESNTGWGILFLPLGDATHQQWLRMQNPLPGKRAANLWEQGYNLPPSSGTKSDTSFTDGETEGQINKEMSRDVNSTK